MKRCGRKECGKEYPATTKHFHRSKSSTDGFDYYCKYCRKELNGKYEKMRGSRDRNDLGTMQPVPGRAAALVEHTTRIRMAIGMG